MNKERGLLVAGSPKLEDEGLPKKMTRKILKKEINDAWRHWVLVHVPDDGLLAQNFCSKDWASREAARLRALCVLAIRMTRKTVVAKILASNDQTTSTHVKVCQPL